MDPATAAFRPCPICNGWNSTAVTTFAKIPLQPDQVWERRDEALAAPRGAIELRLCESCAHLYNAAPTDALQVDAEKKASSQQLRELDRVSEPGRLVTRLRASRPRTAELRIETRNAEQLLAHVRLWDLNATSISYFTRPSLVGLFERHGFRTTKLEESAEQHLLTIVLKPSEEIAYAGIAASERRRITQLVDTFREAVGRKLGTTEDAIDAARASERNVVLWSDVATAATFLNSVIAAEMIEHLIDPNLAHIGSFLAGSGTRIVAPAVLRELMPALVITLDPRICEEVRAILTALNLRAEVVLL